MTVGLNLTGKPITTDYTLGRGIVYFGALDANGNVGEWRDVGNATEFKSTLSVEKLEHKSSRAGLKTVDRSVVVSEELGLSLTLDELNFQNIAFFFSGAADVEANAAAAIAGVTANAAGNLVVTAKGRWYDLYRTTTGRPATDGYADRIYDVGTLTVTSLDAMTTYVLGTDYEVDLLMGRIFILSTGGMAAASYRVNMAANAGAKVTHRVKGLTNSGVAVAVKFIAANPTNADQKTEYEFHSVTLYADGDFSLIGDQWTTMTLKGVAGSNPTSDANSPYVTIRTHADAHS